MTARRQRFAPMARAAGSLRDMPYSIKIVRVLERDPNFPGKVDQGNREKSQRGGEQHGDALLVSNAKKGIGERDNHQKNCDQCAANGKKQREIDEVGPFIQELQISLTRVSGTLSLRLRVQAAAPVDNAI